MTAYAKLLHYVYLSVSTINSNKIKTHETSLNLTYACLLLVCLRFPLTFFHLSAINISLLMFYADRWCLLDLHYYNNF